MSTSTCEVPYYQVIPSDYPCESCPIKLPKIESHDSLLKKKEQQYLTHLLVHTVTTSNCEVSKYLFWLQGSYQLIGSSLMRGITVPKSPFKPRCDANNERDHSSERPENKNKKSTNHQPLILNYTKYNYNTLGLICKYVMPLI